MFGFIGKFLVNVIAGACATGTGMAANDAMNKLIDPPKTKTQAVVKGVARGAITMAITGVMFGAVKGFLSEAKGILPWHRD